MTEHICPEITDEGICPAVVGDVAVWRDDSHLSTYYVESMVPLLERRLPETVPSLDP
ncbi:hypothetical protein [Nesterenkonia sp. F]|uniref:hypothetical protein n=1 Tax=Nesterenkonia sp. F TaxID=795955 RepID=UPI001303CFE2|nr:hypothetical protein [Nesterenkonia sp. F]